MKASLRARAKRQLYPRDDKEQTWDAPRVRLVREEALDLREVVDREEAAVRERQLLERELLADALDVRQTRALVRTSRDAVVLLDQLVSAVEVLGRRRLAGLLARRREVVAAVVLLEEELEELPLAVVRP